jgi:hypothetical protein
MREQEITVVEVTKLVATMEEVEMNLSQSLNRNLSQSLNRNLSQSLNRNLSLG